MNKENKEEITVKESIDKIKGAFQSLYGYVMDDWFAILIRENRINFNRFKKDFDTKNDLVLAEMKKGVEEITEVKKSIKGHIHPVHFTNDKQAGKYALRIYALPSLVALIIGILAFALFLNSNSYLEQKAFFEKYPNLSSLDIFKKEITISPNAEGRQFMILKSVKNIDKAQVGKDAYYDTQRKLIYVPLDDK